MKVLMMNGSPHTDGCTNRALSEIAAVLKEEGIDTYIFQIGSEVAGCRGCRACAKLGKCVINDKVNEFVELSKTADGFVFGSPVYYASPSGAALAFMDRAFYSSGSVFMHKPAAAVTSARRAGTTVTLDCLHKYFFLKQMPIVTSTYWNMVHGNTKEDVEKDLEGLQTMRNLGRNMAYMIKMRKAAEEAGIYPPETESGARTNFIR